MRGIFAAALAVALCCLVVLGSAGGPAAAQAPAGSPNFVVIMADDLHPSMLRALPATKRLVGERGANFSNAIATYPLCCPARATLITGQYAHNHGAKGNNPKSGGGWRSLIDPERNLGAWLQAAGYDTAFAGKWLNGLRTPRKAPPGWDSWWGLVGAGGEGLSSFYDYDIFRAPGRDPRHFGTAASDYQTDALTREYALPLIEAHRTDPDPFFMWLAYHPPHNGLGRNDAAGRRCSTGPPSSRKGKQSAIPPARYARRFENARAPRPASFGERDLSDKPAFVRREGRLDRSDVERIERDYRCGLAALLALDDAVEAIAERLRATGQLDETVLVFTADHGVLAGEHGIARGKNHPYEEALDIPLMISGPGIARGRVAAPVANADIAPTVLELAGAPVPPELARPIDGKSLVPALAGGGADGRRVVPIEGRKNVAKSRRGFKVRSYVGVRTERYAYIEHRRASYRTESEGRQGPIGAGRLTDRELYDLRRDPGQLQSRHRSRAYAGVARELAALTSRLERCIGPACVLARGVPGPR